MSAHRFEEIIQQIKTLADEAESLVPDHALPRAQAYWYAQISMIVDNDHGYLGSCGCSMVDTLEEWHDDDDEEDD